MITLLLLLVFLIVGTVSWFMGLWSNLVTLMVLLLAGLTATNYFEPLAAYLDKPVVGGPAAIGSMGTYTYLLDFVCFWGIFLVALLLLRALTDFASRHRIAFDFWTETIGRSITAIWVAWVFVMIAAFSIQLAPLPNAVVQATPDSGMFLGLAPDRMWIGMMQSRSRGALARGKFSEALRHPDDAGSNVEPFDSQADLVYRYSSRRAALAQLSSLRVARN
ncbi:MAG TPA: hypothetical protein DCQ98_06480 [Planctomycetaceae bacterium]|nr:hypothetical protein [Planctomycetaceae bacterium]HRE99054.1 hypothetical protein [Pirellulaceae bacterium]